MKDVWSWIIGSLLVAAAALLFVYSLPAEAGRGGGSMGGRSGFSSSSRSSSSPSRSSSSSSSSRSSGSWGTSSSSSGSYRSSYGSTHVSEGSTVIVVVDDHDDWNWRSRHRDRGPRPFDCGDTYCELVNPQNNPALAGFYPTYAWQQANVVQVESESAVEVEDEDDNHEVLSAVLGCMLLLLVTAGSAAYYLRRMRKYNHY